MKISLAVKGKNKIFVDGEYSLWESASTHTGPVYTLCEKINEIKKYTTIYGAIGGHMLKPEEALSLAKGETITSFDVSSTHVNDGGYNFRVPVESIIVPRSTTEVEKVVDGRTYVNAVLKLGVAWPMRGKDKRIYAFKCDGEVFLKEYHLAGFTAHLEPKDCFELKDKHQIIKDGFEIHYKGSEAKSFCKGTEHESVKTVAILWGASKRTHSLTSSDEVCQVEGKQTGSRRI